MSSYFKHITDYLHQKESIHPLDVGMGLSIGLLIGVLLMGLMAQ